MAEEMSKSAKRRAAKKARDAAAAEEAAPPTTEPAPKAKAKAKVQAAPAPASTPAPASQGGYPEPKAKAKAKATTKAPASPPVAPEPAPKAKGKAKAKAEPKAEPAPAAVPAPKAKADAKAKAQPQSKSAAKSAPKPAPKKEVDEEPPKKEKEQLQPYEVDDGSGPAWDVCDGLTLKQKRRKERLEEDKKMAAIAKAQGVPMGNKHVPGLTVVDPNQSRIPGMAPSGATAKVAVSQSVNAVPAVPAVTAAKEEAPKAQLHSATVKVPEKMIGVCIGPKGATLKMIQEKTDTRIDTASEIFTITGPAEGVNTAEQAIKDLATKGYTHLAYEDFSENFVMAFKECFPDLIGKKGAVVQALKKELQVEVSFPDTSKSGADKKHKVTIAGSTRNVEKAKEVLNSIMMYGHHEVTHPDDIHEEVEVPDWAYAAIIGKKGSELRHMQNSFKVRVNIPREHSLCENVVVVGEAAGVTRCKAYIEKLLYNFSHQVKGRGSDEKADDGWGEEGPEEDWMKAYMYKRP